MKQKRTTGPKIQLDELIALEDPAANESHGKVESSASSAGSTSATKSNVEKAWDAFARQLVKETLVDEGLGYGELTQRLTSLGLTLTQKVVCRRVSRGHFSGGFFLLCMQALQVIRIDFDGARSGTTLIEPLKTDAGPAKSLKPKREDVSIEGIARGWGAKKGAP